MAKSLMSAERACWVCGSPHVECHHVYGGVGRRKVSDREGCIVYLCREHHQGRTGAHQDPALRDRLRRECERAWLAENQASIEDFIRVFGANYL